MPLIGEAYAYIKLRVDPKQVTKDAEEGLAAVDTNKAGERGGRRYSEGFGREANKQSRKHGESFIQGFAKGITFKAVAIGAAVTGALAVLPAALAGSAIAAGLGIGGFLAIGLAKADPKIKAAAHSLAIGFKQILLKAGQQSGFTNQLVNGINHLTRVALPALGRVFTAIFSAMKPLIPPITNALTHMAIWLANHINPAIARFHAFIVGLKGPTSVLLQQLRSQVWPNVARFLGLMAASAGNSIRAFGNLLVAISPLLPALGILSNLAAKLLGRYPKLIPVIGAVIVAIKAMGIAAKLVAIEWKAALIGSVVGIVLVVAVLIIQHWKTVKAWTLRIWGDIVKFIKRWWFLLIGIITGPLGILVALIIKNWKHIAAWTVSVWNGIVKFIKRWWFLLIGIATGGLGILVALIVKNWKKIAAFTVRAWNGIFNFFKAIWGHIENVFTGAVKAIANWLTTGWKRIAGAIASAWNHIFAFFRNIWNHIKALFHDTLSWIGSFLSRTWSSISNAVSRAWNHIVGVLKGIWKTIKQDFSDTWTWITGKAKSFLAGIGHVIGTGFQVAANLAAGALNGLIQAWDHFANLWSWIPGLKDKGKIKPIGAPFPHAHLAAGGRIPGYAPGRDTVPAMLSPGEFVINPRAAKAIGYDKLHALNSVATVHAATGGQIVSTALRYNGHPYTWGGSPPGHFDCSSFVNMILDMNHVRVPGGWHIGQGHGPTTVTWLNSGYPKVPYSQMRPGDLYVNGHHMGIVTGPGTGFAARSTATGTGPQRVGAGNYQIERVTNSVGFFGGIAGLISAAASNAANFSLGVFRKYMAWHALHGAGDQVIGGGVRFGAGKLFDYTNSIVQAALAQQAALGAAGGQGNPIGPVGNIAGKTQWAQALLRALGIPTSPGAVGALVHWATVEGGHWNNSAHFNPLNTTEGGPGVVGSFGVGIKAYDSWQHGIEATVKTLRLGAYRGILAALRSGSMAAVGNAVLHSPWGTVNWAQGGLVKERRYRTGGVLPENVYGIGPSGTRYRMEAGESVVPGGSMLEQKLDRLIAAMESAPAKTAAGVAKGIAAPRGAEAQAARLAAR